MRETNELEGSVFSSTDKLFFEALLREMPDIIYFKDRDSRFIRCSQAHAKMFGLEDPDEMVGKSDADYFEDGFTKEKLESEVAMMSGGPPIINLEERGILNDGSREWVLTSKVPVRDEHGDVIGLVGISRNIDKYKEAQLKGEEAHERLMELSRHIGRSEIASSVLHNVGNVLNSINVSSVFIQERVEQSDAAMLEKIVDLLDKPAEELVDFLKNDLKGRNVVPLLRQLAATLRVEREENCRELETLRDNLFHIKTIITSQQDVARGETLDTLVSVEEVIDSAIAINVAGLERHGVILDTNVSNIPPLVFDKHRMLQVLINLISNAKYASRKSDQEEPTIHVDAYVKDDQLHIVVADNGCGIASEDLDRVFEYGFTKRRDGNGLGLHSSVIAVKEMNGEMKVESPGLGEGATFIVTIPAIPEKR